MMVFFFIVGGKGLSEQETDSQVDIWEVSVRASGKSSCKDPEVGISCLFQKQKKKSHCEQSLRQGRGRVPRKEVGTAFSRRALQTVVWSLSSFPSAVGHCRRGLGSLACDLINLSESLLLQQ